MKRAIAIDFDGVIHQYRKGYQDGQIYDEEVKGAFDAISKMQAAGHPVFILSSRNPWQIKKWVNKRIFIPWYGDFIPAFGFTTQVIMPWSKFWTKTNVLGITRRKLPAIAYIDDRAIYFDSRNDKWEKEKIQEILNKAKN